jgi:prepilin-type N-terminal cleavage/methylation domain-containing protein
MSIALPTQHFMTGQPMRGSNLSRGFSLVELLVALAIVATLLIAVAGYVVTQRQSNRITLAMAQNDDNTRIITELIARDIRTAGYLPCGTRLLNSNAQPAIEVFGTNPTLPPPFNNLSNTLRIDSALLVRYANPDTVADVTASGNSVTLTLPTNPLITAQSYANLDVILCDAKERAVRTRVNNVSGNTLTITANPNLDEQASQRIAIFEERLWIYGSSDRGRDCSTNRCSIFLARAVTRNGNVDLMREEYATDVCPTTFIPVDPVNPTLIRLVSANRLTANAATLDGCRGLDISAARRN